MARALGLGLTACGALAAAQALTVSGNLGAGLSGRLANTLCCAAVQDSDRSAVLVEGIALGNGMVLSFRPTPQAAASRVLATAPAPGDAPGWSLLDRSDGPSPPLSAEMTAMVAAFVADGAIGLTDTLGPLAASSDQGLFTLIRLRERQWLSGQAALAPGRASPALVASFQDIIVPLGAAPLLSAVVGDPGGLDTTSTIQVSTVAASAAAVSAPGTLALVCAGLALLPRRQRTARREADWGQPA